LVHASSEGSKEIFLSPADAADAVAHVALAAAAASKKPVNPANRLVNTDKRREGRRSNESGLTDTFGAYINLYNFSLLGRILECC
jgi:hypothetical protein